MKECKTELIELTEYHLTDIDFVGGVLKSFIDKVGVVGGSRVIESRLGVGKTLQIYIEVNE